jgi:lysozyme family protein
VLLASASIWEAKKPKTKPVRHTPPTRYETLWDSTEIHPRHLFRTDKAVALYKDTKRRYVTIQNQRKNGVPAPIIFCLHGRESTWSFSRHLHEGSSLRRRTKYIPKGRPRKGSPPFTFEESAEDALYILKSLNKKNWKTVDSALTQVERYNGTGYLRYHPNVNSPYLWAGTNHYTRGKYVADGRFSATAVDKQLGCCAILKRMQQRGIDVGFE